jgi:hypothetical protein
MTTAHPSPLTPEEMAVVRRAQLSFSCFLEEVFARSFDGERFRMADRRLHPFALGDVHRAWAVQAQSYNRLCVLAPRMHLKSTILNHAFVFWNLFKGAGDVDALVFSYKDQLAREHLAITKRLIKLNPYTRLWRDRRASSDYLINFEVTFGDGLTWLGKADGSGILSASRGRHPKLVVCDDILSDYANALETTQLQRIDNIFRQVVMSLPDPHAPLIVVGTPQSYEDTLFQLKDDPTFHWMREPAVFDDTTQATLWPERFDYRGLMRQRAAIKDRAFQVEYLLIPAAFADAFLAPGRVRDCVDEDLTMYSLETPFSNPHHFPVYMGVDVGKSLHPSHLSVFLQGPDGTLVMLYHEFMDHLNYAAQTKHINRVIQHFDVTKGYHDNTRAELEDRGLSKRLRGVRFTKSKKANMAVLFERRIDASGDEPGIVLLPDGRMLRQISAVTKDLKSVETSEGHGDTFWSIALAVWAAADGPGMADLGDVNEMFGNGRPRPARTD